MTEKRRNTLLLACLLIVVTAVRLHADDVDDYVKAVMQQRHIPAASIAVIKDGVLVKTAGYGLADMEHNGRLSS